MTASWRADASGIGLGDGWAMLRGLTGDNQPHAHHAVQLVIGNDAFTQVELGEAGRLIKAPGCIIGSGVCHQLLPGPTPVQLLYLDSSHHLGQQLHTRVGAGIQILDEPTCRALHRAVVATSTEPPWTALCLQLKLDSMHSVPLHPALQRVLESLDQQLAGPLRIQQVAKQMSCSTSHAARLFRTQIGLPLRAYLRWRRLIRAVHAVAQGSDLTRAAAEAGFSDSAHLSRTMRQTFGIEARTLLKLGLPSPSTD